MIRSFLKAFLITLGLFGVMLIGVSKSTSLSNASNTPWWHVQSIDTMKYSRDLTREKINDPSFDITINEHVKNIAQTGATHVGIATPYDEEFIPMLTRWVKAARANNLNVWFRGNFSGWEKWFDYPRMSRQEHMEKTISFIHTHRDVFRDGDIFTACPECENGGPGDPRLTGDTDGFRLFMITEYTATSKAFSDIGKQVITNYNSMNLDVAKLIMDKNTTHLMGGVVAIDHYVASPKKLAGDVTTLAQTSGGKIFLAEFGAPIPDIHGDMNDAQQAKWIEEALFHLRTIKELIGVNYWVNVGGSTQLWSDDGTPKKAVQAVTQTFKPPAIHGKLVNQFNRPITNATIQTPYKTLITDAFGQYTIPYFSDSETITIKIQNYTDMTVHVSDLIKNNIIIIEKISLSWFESILDYLNNLFSNRS